MQMVCLNAVMFVYNIYILYIIINCKYFYSFNFKHLYVIKCAIKITSSVKKRFMLINWLYVNECFYIYYSQDYNCTVFKRHIL